MTNAGRIGRGLAGVMLAGALLLATTTCGGDGDKPPVVGSVGSGILFVTQVPVGGFQGVTGTFSNHLPEIRYAPRGGALMLREDDGTLRNLTQEAGFGMTGFQGKDAIAVREPCVHWDGKKALFSMVIGAPTAQFEGGTWFWQIYEVTGLGKGEKATIRKIANQPPYNNVSAIYGSDDKILFSSDRPRSGEAHLYPQLDEYESSPTPVGIYSLDETAGKLVLLEHAPSGDFHLSLDSFGRVIFTKWDHIQRDQQADSAEYVERDKPFTWQSEAQNASTSTTIAGTEVFPEARDTTDSTYDPTYAPMTFNHFMPWEMNEDGSEEETLNHVGRHEFGGSYTDGSYKADSNLSFIVGQGYQKNQHRIEGRGGLFHLREDPTTPGRFYATLAPEFSTGSGGTLVRFEAAPTVNPEDMEMVPVTPTDNQANVPKDTGFFRNPTVLASGKLIASHTDASGYLDDDGSAERPDWNYDYRLRELTQQGTFYVPGGFLTSGIKAELSWWTPDVMATWSGTLWELDPVEVRARPRPAKRPKALPDAEKAAFAAAGVDIAKFQTWLRERDLALIVSRNVTLRDRADTQQPFNLRVPGGVSSVAKGGPIYDITHMQVFQADQVRGYQVRDGRRTLPIAMHGADVGPTPAGAPPGSVALGKDGSMAAIVPARRALSWQTVGPGGKAVVRERVWVSFAPGEIRACPTCHGVNKMTQMDTPIPETTPEALKALLTEWLAQNGP
jgi:hypothetical protein